MLASTKTKADSQSTSPAVFSWIGKPIRVNHHKVYYSAVHFVRTNALVRVGDDITLQNASHTSSSPAVACVDSLWLDSVRRVGCLTVRWYYRIQDVPPLLFEKFPLGNPAPNEIFLSEMQGDFDIHSIVIGRAHVIRSEANISLQPSQYLSRVSFSPIKHTFGPLLLKNDCDRDIKEPQIIVESSSMERPHQKFVIYNHMDSNIQRTIDNKEVGLTPYPDKSASNISTDVSDITQKVIYPGNAKKPEDSLRTPEENSILGARNGGVKTSGSQRNRHCLSDECLRQPSFGYDGMPPQFCAMHKLDGMTNVVSRRCEAEDCKRQPIYGSQGEKRPRFCRAHKVHDMVDVKNRRCEASGCMVHPTYGFPGQKRRFCGSHKSAGMLDFKSSRCSAEGCSRRPSYALKGKRATRCSGHKVMGMIDVKHRRCDAPNCNKRVESKKTNPDSLNTDTLQQSSGVFCVIHRNMNTSLDFNNNKKLHAPNDVDYSTKRAPLGSVIVPPVEQQQAIS